jgi:glycine/D-amino acid oxidase-like deaminating enzyme
VVQSRNDDILIVGAGIGGLTLALSLRAAGLGKRVRVFEAVQELKPVGGGINLGPHAIKVLSGLGLEPALLAVSKQPHDYAFFTSHGQFVYREPWGKAAGHRWRISPFTAPSCTRSWQMPSSNAWARRACNSDADASASRGTKRRRGRRWSASIVGNQKRTLVPC